jgi:hypothetical protein
MSLYPELYTEEEYATKITTILLLKNISSSLSSSRFGRFEPIQASVRLMLRNFGHPVDLVPLDTIQ